MRELMWPPGAISGLTMAQLGCLCSERPPGDQGGRKTSWEEMAAALAEQDREAAKWSNSDRTSWS